MPRLTRTEKYKELRDSLNDGIQTNDKRLEDYAQRLNDLQRKALREKEVVNERIELDTLKERIDEILRPREVEKEDLSTNEQLISKAQEVAELPQEKVKPTINTDSIFITLDQNEINEKVDDSPIEQSLGETKVFTQKDLEDYIQSINNTKSPKTDLNIIENPGVDNVEDVIEEVPVKVEENVVNVVRQEPVRVIEETTGELDKDLPTIDEYFSTDDIVATIEEEESTDVFVNDEISMPIENNTNNIEEFVRPVKEETTGELDKDLPTIDEYFSTDDIVVEYPEKKEVIEVKEDIEPTNVVETNIENNIEDTKEFSNEEIVAPVKKYEYVEETTGELDKDLPTIDEYFSTDDIEIPAKEVDVNINAINNQVLSEVNDIVDNLKVNDEIESLDVKTETDILNNESANVQAEPLVFSSDFGINPIPNPAIDSNLNDGVEIERHDFVNVENNIETPEVVEAKEEVVPEVIASEVIDEIKTETTLDDYINEKYDLSDNYLNETIAEVNAYNRSEGERLIDDIPVSIIDEVRNHVIPEDRLNEQQANSDVVDTIEYVNENNDEESLEEIIEKYEEKVEPEELEVKKAIDDVFADLNDEKVVDNPSLYENTSETTLIKVNNFLEEEKVNDDISDFIPEKTYDTSNINKIDSEIITPSIAEFEHEDTKVITDEEIRHVDDFVKDIDAIVSPTINEVETNDDLGDTKIFVKENEEVVIPNVDEEISRIDDIDDDDEFSTTVSLQINKIMDELNTMNKEETIPENLIDVKTVDPVNIDASYYDKKNVPDFISAFFNDEDIDDDDDLDYYNHPVKAISQEQHEEELAQTEVVEIKNISELDDPAITRTIEETKPFIVDEDASYVEDTTPNKLLNVILIALIVVFLIVLFIIIYYILVARGVI